MLLEELNKKTLDAYDSPISIDEWMGTTSFKKLSKMPYEELKKKYFNRDPERKIKTAENMILSPADGIIIYQDEYHPVDDILDVKGKKFTIRKLLEDKKFNTSCVVIGIFMTIYDVHINRVPYSGTHKWRDLPPIKTTNRSMGIMEDDEILHKHLAKKDLDKGAAYLFNNERVVNEFYIPEHDYTYYVIQIADKEVDSIEVFSDKQGEKTSQGEKFGRIAEGSQVDLVLPLPLWGEPSFMTKRKWHVKAGDPLVKISS